MTIKTHIAIIGSGFGGLGTAIRLKQSGIDDFLVLERANEVGGTWRDNTYPGCACDVESPLYSFSFAPNPRWSRLFSAQPEIQQYLRDCAERFEIRPHLRLGHDVLRAVWEAPKRRWRLETSRGTYEARFLVAATGALCEPRIPEFPGLERFRGKLMHSARWDHDYDLTGRKVAVVGTGASAIQFVPRIQPQVAQLHLFQRTAPWVVPHLDRPISDRERWVLTRAPVLQRFWRYRIFATRELLGVGFRNPWLMKVLEKAATRHLHRAVSDPELRRKLTPHYRIGCKRILISNDYYPSLTRTNVQVVTDAIASFREHAIVTRDGTEREIDTVIMGTGFQVTSSPFAGFIHGHGGRSLADAWNGSPRGYLGTTVVGFPNFFLLLGPNTGLGHSSVVTMIESQIEHVLSALRFAEKERVTALEPTAEAEARFNAEVDARMRKTVWVTGGCSSWYLDRTGRNSTLWPSSIPAFRRRVEPFHPSEYRIIARAPQRLTKGTASSGGPKRKSAELDVSSRQRTARPA